MSETQLVERLEKLERDNRRLKGFAVAVLVLAAAFGTIYATQPVPQKMTAHEFDVVDSAGRSRVLVAVLQGGPRIDLLDEQGMARLSMTVSSQGVPNVVLLDTQGTPLVAMMGISPKGGPGISLWDALGKVRAGMYITPDALPSLLLSDPRGFEMALGSAQTIIPATGAFDQFSAASIVMFGRDKKVIWKAP